MRYMKVAVAIFGVALVGATSAPAYRSANRTERAALTRAFDRASHLRVPARCFVNRISTVNRRWAMQFWRFDRAGQPLPGCSNAGNGFNLLHHRRGRWHYVFSGPAVTYPRCEIHGVPRAVVRDFKLC